MRRAQILTLAALSLTWAGCGNQHPLGTTYNPGYLATDACTSVADQKTCLAKDGCDWLEIACPTGATCPPGVCYEPSPCLKITDQAACQKDTRCAWSQVDKLCPVGAECGSGGFCHPRSSGGDGCACVSPVACPNGQNCPPPECDCSGGGQGGGGTCTCACPSCDPATGTCPPCKCDCGPSGGSGSGCVDDGTCTCTCAPCDPNGTCPPCACGCGSGGPVPAPQPPPPDPCMKHADQQACMGDTTNKCSWYAFGAPCVDGQPCQTGVCQSAGTDPSGNTGSGGGSTGSGGAAGCGCACPGCDPATGTCPPCTCDCGQVDPGCVPPAPPPSPTDPGQTPCPAIGCEIYCVNGHKKDANGCPTCECL